MEQENQGISMARNLSSDCCSGTSKRPKLGIGTYALAVVTVEELSGKNTRPKQMGLSHAALHFSLSFPPSSWAHAIERRAVLLILSPIFFTKCTRIIYPSVRQLPLPE